MNKPQRFTFEGTNVVYLADEAAMYISSLESMLAAVTAVCNGSSAMTNLDQFRAADVLLQEEQNAEQRMVLSECDSYLNADRLNTIGSGSKLHQDIKRVLRELW